MNLSSSQVNRGEGKSITRIHINCPNARQDTPIVGVISSNKEIANLDSCDTNIRNGGFETNVRTLTSMFEQAALSNFSNSKTTTTNRSDLNQIKDDVGSVDSSKAIDHCNNSRKEKVILNSEICKSEKSNKSPVIFDENQRSAIKIGETRKNSSLLEDNKYPVTNRCNTVKCIVPERDDLTYVNVDRINRVNISTMPSAKMSQSEDRSKRLSKSLRRTEHFKRTAATKSFSGKSSQLRMSVTTNEGEVKSKSVISSSRHSSPKPAAPQPNSLNGNVKPSKNSTLSKTKYMLKNSFRKSTRRKPSKSDDLPCGSELLVPSVILPNNSPGATTGLRKGKISKQSDNNNNSNRRVASKYTENTHITSPSDIRTNNTNKINKPDDDNDEGEIADGSRFPLLQQRKSLDPKILKSLAKSRSDKVTTSHKSDNEIDGVVKSRGRGRPVAGAAAAVSTSIGGNVSDHRRTSSLVSAIPDEQRKVRRSSAVPMY